MSTPCQDLFRCNAPLVAGTVSPPRQESGNRNSKEKFAVSSGSLNELPGSPFALPAAATPFGIVVTGEGAGE
jgi:hypothetical protein